MLPKRADRDVVGQFVARKQLRHDAAVRIGRVDADQGKARHFGGRDPLATGERVILRHDAEQAAGGQRQEIQRGMIQPVADRGAVALAKQQIVDHLLEFEDVDVHLQVGVALADSLYGTRHHDLRDARHRADPQLGKMAAADLADDVAEIVDLLVDGVDLLEDDFGVLGREVAAVLPHEEANAERALGIFDEPADAGRGDVEKLRRASDRSRDHHGPNDFDLPQRHHRRGITVAGRLN